MKKTITVIMVALMLFALVGCENKSDNNASTTTQATTTAPTTIPTTTPTTPNDEELYQPTDIPEAFWDVMNNKQTFKLFDSETAEFNDTYLDEYTFPYLEEAIAASEVEYCVIDIDDDGKVELVLTSLDTLILREADGAIYGYEFPFSWMVTMYADGSFDFMDEYELGTGKLCFDENGAYSVTELAKIVVNDDFEPVEYYIAGETVDEDTYMEYIMENEAADADWSTFERYPFAD